MNIKLGLVQHFVGEARWMNREAAGLEMRCHHVLIGDRAHGHEVTCSSRAQGVGLVYMYKYTICVFKVIHVSFIT